MRIVFDNIVFSLQKSGGISVVWYELAKRILKEKDVSIQFIDNNEFVNPYRQLLNLEGLLLQKDTLPAVSRYLTVDVSSSKPFIFHSSYYRYCSNPKAINITTVHDFTYEYYRGGIAKWIHCWQKNRAIMHSKRIVCISEHTKKDLIKFLPSVDESKIRVIYNGVSEEYFVLESNKGQGELPFAKGTYLVYVGSRTGYKNFELVKKTLGSSDYNLVIVGSNLTDIEESGLQKYLPKERYYATGFLPNKKLNILYNNAAALVYPSAYEGFGIPIVEAQKAGCPVIALSSSSIPEVIGETPLLMKEATENELLQKIKLLSDKQLMDKVIDDGLNNSKRFSWDKMCYEYIKLYKEALE